MNRRLIIANWKMQLSVAGAVALAKQLRKGTRAGNQLVLCPSFTAIRDVGAALRGSTIALGAQNLATAVQGPFTGEVSVRDLRSLGCRYVIVGHSDRRALGETDRRIGQKLALAVSHGLTPILCVGERLADRRAGRSRQVVIRQVRTGLRGLSTVTRRNVLVTYEPVWAISPGGPIDPPEAFRMAEVIWRTLGGSRRPLIYGGSVSPQNIEAYLDGRHYRGALVGKASLTARSLRALLV